MKLSDELERWWNDGPDPWGHSRTREAYYQDMVARCRDLEARIARALAVLDDEQHGSLYALRKALEGPPGSKHWEPIVGEMWTTPGKVSADLEAFAKVLQAGPPTPTDGSHNGHSNGQKGP